MASDDVLVGKNFAKIGVFVTLSLNDIILH